MLLKSNTEIEAFSQGTKTLQGVFSRASMPPYSKSLLAKFIREKSIDIQTLNKQLQGIPNLAAQCMDIALKELHLKGILSPYEKIHQNYYKDCVSVQKTKVQESLDHNLLEKALTSSQSLNQLESSPKRQHLKRMRKKKYNIRP